MVIPDLHRKAPDETTLAIPLGAHHDDRPNPGNSLREAIE